MIIDLVENAASYKGLSEALDITLDALCVEELKSRPCEWHELGRAGVRFNRVSADTQPRGERSYEVHRKNLDVHCVLEGRERMLFAGESQMQTLRSYDDKDDYELVEAEQHGEVLLTPGWFCICFPQDAHIALVCDGAPSRVEKVIFKVPTGR